MTVMALLYLAAFTAAVIAAIGKAPLWVAVILLCIAGLLTVFPLGGS
jgi:hypothetical protein